MPTTPATTTESAYELLRTGLDANFEIHVENVVFRVQTHPLALHSEYFRRLLAHTNTVEMTERKLKIEDVPACLMARVILHCYSPNICLEDSVLPEHFGHTAGTWKDKYLLVEGPIEEDTVPIPHLRSKLNLSHLTVRLFELADRFLMPSLTDYSRTGFSKNWFYTSIDRYGDSHFKDAICGVIEQVYALSPPHDSSLIDLVVETLRNEAFPPPATATSPTQFIIRLNEVDCWRKLLAQEPRITTDILSSMYSDKLWTCDDCETRRHVVLKSCKCEVPILDCTDWACVDKRIAENWCNGCGAWGTMR